MNDLVKLLSNVTTQLHALNLQVTTAESCTGGELASLLTRLPGSSHWFDRGFITYSNLAKEEILGVDKKLIQQHGAVSEDVAKAMALGALQHSVAQLALAVTGIAGPGGGSLDKPVGTVCFAWAMREKWLTSVRCHFSESSRDTIRTLACGYALERLLSYLKGDDHGI